jgi:hypothetical protein
VSVNTNVFLTKARVDFNEYQLSLCTPQRCGPWGEDFNLPT